MQELDDEDDKMSVTTTASDMEDDSSITQDDSPKMKRKKTVIRIAKRKRQKQSSEGNLGSKFMKNFMDLASDLRKERVSESSNVSGGKNYLSKLFPTYNQSATLKTTGKNIQKH